MSEVQKSSIRRSAASRLNGRRGRGPKTPEGRGRSSRNALKHGLSLPASRNPTQSKEVLRLATLIAGEAADATRMSISQLVAEAQFDVIRIREVRTQILAEDGFQRLPPPRPRSDYRRYTYRDGKKIIQPHSSGGTKPLTEAERADALDKALKILEAVTRPPPPSVDKMLRSIEKIATLDRYERRAVSRRKRALRLLHEDYKRGVKPRRASPSNQNSK